MGTMLSAAAIEQYRRDGYYCPLRVMSVEAAGDYRERLESVERDLGGPLRGPTGAADVVLQPGEMSLHHVLIVHGSRPNTSF
jgi:hypothetical protein